MPRRSSTFWKFLWVFSWWMSSLENLRSPDISWSHCQPCSHPVAPTPSVGKGGCHWQPAFGAHSTYSGHLRLYPSYWHVYDSFFLNILSESALPSSSSETGTEVGLFTTQSRGSKDEVLIVTIRHHMGEHISLRRGLSVRVVITYHWAVWYAAPPVLGHQSLAVWVSELTLANCRMIPAFFP